MPVRVQSFSTPKTSKESKTLLTEIMSTSGIVTWHLAMQIKAIYHVIKAIKQSYKSTAAPWDFFLRLKSLAENQNIDRVFQVGLFFFFFFTG